MPNPCWQGVEVMLVAAAGALLGAWFSRLPKFYWAIGYVLPFSIIFLLAVAVHEPAVAFIPPVSWLMLGHQKFAATGFITAMVLTTPLMKLSRRKDQWAVGLLMFVTVCAVGIWPVVQPAFNRASLAALTTRMDGNGICLQSTSYTYGPASAVTALRRLGFDAEEGEIAVLAGTGSTIGTPPYILAQTLQKRYASVGLVCEHRAFKNLDELKAAGLTLAVTKYNFYTDHYVTVLKVTDETVTVGDPLSGLSELSRDEFEAKWRFQGVVLSRR